MALLVINYKVLACATISVASISEDFLLPKKLVISLLVILAVLLSYMEICLEDTENQLAISASIVTFEMFSS